jgi:Cu+-exporting ATPase
MTALAIDPVCGMRIDEIEARGSIRYEGRTYHFCSELCRAKFEADAERYAIGSGAQDARP